MRKFIEWLRQRDKDFVEAGTPTAPGTVPQVQQAPSPFSGVPPQVTTRLQQLGQAGQGVMQRAQQIMQQRPGTNMAMALQNALGEYEQVQQQPPQPGTPPNQWGQLPQQGPQGK